MILFWSLVFVVSLFILVKGADLLINSSEKIGLAMGLSPFLVGITIVAAGTSFPELVSSIFAIFNGLADVPVANAVGSNIANILLVGGAAAFFGGRLVVSKSLIDLDLPLLGVSTVLLLGVVADGQVVFLEAILLLVGYGIYALYTIASHDLDDDDTVINFRLSRSVKKGKSKVKSTQNNLKIKNKDFILLFLGIIGLVLGARYLIDSLIILSQALSIAPGVIAITAVALGTSLPELVVSIRSAFSGKSEVALGNIIGSNIFNALLVVGIPGLFKTLTLDTQTLTLGLPVLAVATLLFIISGISRRVHMWEGGFYLLLYILFLSKLFGWM